MGDGHRQALERCAQIGGGRGGGLGRGWSGFRSRLGGVGLGLPCDLEAGKRLQLDGGGLLGLGLRLDLREQVVGVVGERGRERLCGWLGDRLRGHRLEAEVLGTDRIRARRRERAHQHALQLAQVAGPGVVAEQQQRLGIQVADPLPALAAPGLHGGPCEALHGLRSASQGRQPDREPREGGLEARLEPAAGLDAVRVGCRRHEAQPPRAQGAGRGCQGDVVAQLALQGLGEAIHLLEAERERRPRPVRVRGPLDGLEQAGQVSGAPAVDGPERAARGASEGVDVASEQRSPGAQLPADQQRNVAQSRVDRAQQLRHLEPGEVAAEAGRHGVADVALGERVEPTPGGHGANALAQHLGLRGKGQHLRAQGVEQARDLLPVAGLAEEQPARRREACLVAVCELELLLQVARQAEQDQVRSLQRLEVRIRGRAEHRVVPDARQAGQGGPRGRIPMDDPEAGHGEDAPAGFDICSYCTARAEAQSSCQRGGCASRRHARGPPPRIHTGNEQRTAALPCAPPARAACSNCPKWGKDCHPLGPRCRPQGRLRE